jgi:hypothetical protein
MACRSASMSSSYKYTSENRPDPGGSKTMSMSYKLALGFHSGDRVMLYQVICGQ